MNITAEQINDKIDEIYEVLSSLNPTLNFGILGGELGKAFFYIYYASYKENDEILKKAFQIISVATQNLSKNLSEGISLAKGLSSLAWIISHVEKYNFFDTGSKNLLNQLDDVLYTRALKDFQSGNYDYLHGALSAGNYFLNRKKTKIVKSHLVAFVQELDRLAIQDELYVRWEHFNHEKSCTEHHVYNLGLAHGMPSIIIFLINCYENEIAKDLARSLVLRSVAFLLANKQEPTTIGSAFSYSSKENGNTAVKSRLAWCYGDLGILYVLVRAVYRFGLDHISPRIDEITDHICTRQTIHDESVYDAGFCHGSSGVAYMFFKLFQLTGDERYFKAYEFWRSIIFKMANSDDGLAGFQSFFSQRSPQWSNDPGLIEGIAGIGLTLISFNTAKSLHWDEIFILR